MRAIINNFDSKAIRKLIDEYILSFDISMDNVVLGQQYEHEKHLHKQLFEIGGLESQLLVKR